VGVGWGSLDPHPTVHDMALRTAEKTARRMAMEEKVKVKKHPYYYVKNFTVGANQTVVDSLAIDDHDFVALEVNRTSSGSFQLKIIATGEDRQYTNDWVNEDNFFGYATSTTGKRAYRFPVPMRFPARTVVNFEVKDTSGSPNTIQIALIGYKRIQQ
jgi:hypothetical protein